MVNAIELRVEFVWQLCIDTLNITKNEIMEITMSMADEILNKIYAAYGSGSGILFGIKEREIVEAIIKFTLSEVALKALNSV